VAYIFQVPEKQFIRSTVAEEIAHGVRTLGLEEDEVAERVDRLLETVQLAGRRDASPYVLSHGQKRRLSVACMVVADPDVVVLDEPTFGQDWRQAQNLMAFMRRLADSGAAVVFITHDMRLVAQYADRCAALVGGRKIFDGTPLELFAAAEVLAQARLKAPPIHAFSKPLVGEHLLDPAELVQRIAEEGHARARAVL
jgi:energy-coupling factor transport system ATP-binding protein